MEPTSTLAVLTDALTKGFITDAAYRHLAFVVISLSIIAAVLTYIIKRGEKDVGFDPTKAIDNIENAADIYRETHGVQGTVWPITVLLLAGIAGCVVIAALVVQ